MKLFKITKIEELNDDEFQLNKENITNNIIFDEVENDSESVEKGLKNVKKTLKNGQKQLKNDEVLSKTNKKHYEGHRHRLKEKILNNDLEAIPDYELLEALLTYSIPRSDVKPLAKALLKKFSNFKNLCLAPNTQLSLVAGVGPNTLCFFKILNEIYCRFERLEVLENISLGSPERVAVYCKARMGHLKHEQFRVLFLNKKNRLIKDLVLQNGTIDRAAIFPRELVLQALHIGAGALILVHNHPSGDPSPSKADISITEEIKKAANYLDISLYDHVIIAKNAYYSMKKHEIF